jgi:alpha-beta hydrolase superfamily lysophospholipase
MRKTALLVATFAFVGALLAASAISAPSHTCVQKDELWFFAADGPKLVGHRFGGKKPGARTAVVLAHMSEGDLCVWAPYARRLARKGFFVFPFDFRGHGFSEGGRDHSQAALDIAGAVRAVRGLGARKVVVVGASLGGIAAVIAAPSIRPALKGVVSVSGPAAIAGELDALPAAPRLRVPTLYLAAEQDQNGPYDFAADAQALFDATGTTEKKLEVAPGALHGTFLVAGSARVRAVLERFLRDPARSVP